MDVHASPAGLPELKEFLGAFRVLFRRPEGADALDRYTTGLLTELSNKNCDTIAHAVSATSEQRLREFLTNMQWDEEDLNRQRVGKMIAEATSHLSRRERHTFFSGGRRGAEGRPEHGPHEAR